jgi:hypothetical protein
MRVVASVYKAKHLSKDIASLLLGIDDKTMMELVPFITEGIKEYRRQVMSQLMIDHWANGKYTHLSMNGPYWNFGFDNQDCIHCKVSFCITMIRHHQEVCPSIPEIQQKIVWDIIIDISSNIKNVFRSTLPARMMLFFQLNHSVARILAIN